jgi:hypothetical protein
MKGVGRRVGCAVLAGALAFGFASSGGAGAAAPARAQSASSRFARFQVVPAANLGLYVSRTAEGSIQVDGRAGELTFTKVVSADGTFTLALTTGADAVSIAFQGNAIKASRNGREVVVQAGDEASLERVGALIAGSRAVRLLRTVSTAVQDADDTSVGGAAVLMADALVGALTGDAGAPGRIARHLGRKSLSGVRRVEISEESCYKNYEHAVIEAYIDGEACLEEIGWWNPLRYGCSFTWLLEVETEWFHMWACVGFNF